MPTFEKDGKKHFSMNPQVGRATHGGGSKPGHMKGEEKLEEEIHPGIHEEVHHKLEQYDGHEHNGHALAHHVEKHHGGHPEGNPPQHEGHVAHTIHHPHDGGEPEIHNHENHEEAHQDMSDSLHEGCAQCGEEEEGHGDMEPGKEVSEENDDHEE